VDIHEIYSVGKLLSTEELTEFWQLTGIYSGHCDCILR